MRGRLSVSPYLCFSDIGKTANYKGGRGFSPIKSKPRCRRRLRAFGIAKKSPIGGRGYNRLFLRRQWAKFHKNRWPTRCGRWRWTPSSARNRGIPACRWAWPTRHRDFVFASSQILRRRARLAGSRPFCSFGRTRLDVALRDFAFDGRSAFFDGGKSKVSANWDRAAPGIPNTSRAGRSRPRPGL